ncbi:MAG: hypothetical protein LOD91_11230, partial [Limnochordales bacterium]
MLQRLNQITARWLFALLAGAIALGFWLSAPLAPAAGLAPSFLAVMIFAVASSLDMGAFRRAGREPGLWLRSFLLSYIPFPTMAWVAGQLLFPDDPLLRLGLMLLALVPTANTSTVYTALAGGDVAFALTGIALLFGSGMLDVEHFVEFASLDVIMFLIGMMIVIGYLEEKDFFARVLDRVLPSINKGAVTLMVALMGLSFISAALVDEVTSILFMAAITMRVAKHYG